MMSTVQICVALLSVLAIAHSTPVTQESTLLSLLDELLPKSFQLSDLGIDIKPNDYQSNDVTKRSGGDQLEDRVEDYLKRHDVTVKLPFEESSVTLGGRNLDSDQLDVKVRFGSGTGTVEARKSKLKKLFVPIFIFILIKAIVFIPLLLGVLTLKAHNVLQLSFVSFVVAISLGVWQLCKKVVGDNHQPQIIAHNPWNAARSLDAAALDEVQKLAYSAYAPQ